MLTPSPDCSCTYMIIDKGIPLWVQSRSISFVSSILQGVKSISLSWFLCKIPKIIYLWSKQPLYICYSKIKKKKKNIQIKLSHDCLQSEAFIRQCSVTINLRSAIVFREGLGLLGKISQTLCVNYWNKVKLTKIHRGVSDIFKPKVTIMSLTFVIIEIFLCNFFFWH